MGVLQRLSIAYCFVALLTLVNARYSQKANISVLSRRATSDFKVHKIVVFKNIAACVGVTSPLSLNHLVQYFILQSFIVLFLILITFRFDHIHYFFLDFLEFNGIFSFFC